MSNVHSDDIFSLISSLQKSQDTDKLIVEILSFASDIAQADGCFLYKITPSKYINLEYINIKSLRLSVKGASCDKFFAPEYLPQSKNKKNKHPSEICAVTKDILNTPNLYNEPSIDASALKIFDLENSYNSVSLLAFPLFDSNENVISVVQFINAKNSDGKTVTFSTKIQDQVVSLCQLISVLLERQQQAIIYNKFLESIVSTFTKIILSKAPHISSIKNSVPVIAQMIAVAASTTSDENFKDFEMSDNQWNLLNIASWIYDCGRIMAPDYVLNKSTKLETVSNRIHEIRNRFEILRRDAHIEYLQKRLNNVADKEILQAEFVSKVKKLHDDFNFVGLCNNDTFDLSEEDISRLDEIASQTFTRYFDRSVGLSPQELVNTNTKNLTDTEVENLIQDRPEQISSEYNNGELSNLKIVEGTLNPTEKDKTRQHILSTSEILSSVPFPKEYSDVVEIINTYNKLMLGNNTSQKDHSKTTTIAKIIHLATIFASLSANQTPFFKPKKLSEIMKTMQKLKNNRVIDPDLYDLFVKSEIYSDYAKEHLNADQIDEINIEEII